MLRVWIETENKTKMELTNSPYFEDIEVDGLLSGKASISSTKLANVDGSLITSASSDDRTIGFTIKPAFPVEENRQRLYKIFRKKKYVTIYLKNQNRNVKIKGMVENVDGSLYEEKQTILIDVLCNDPNFKDVLESHSDMSHVIDLFEFPFSIEKEGKEFSRIDKTILKNVENKGDTEIGMVIELIASGTVVNPTIYKVENRALFGLNFTMEDGDLIRINTIGFSNKVTLIRNGQETNIINNVIKDITWLQLEVGDNNFTFTCDSGEEFLNIKFVYSNEFEGI